MSMTPEEKAKLQKFLLTSWPDEILAMMEEIAEDAYARGHEAGYDLGYTNGYEVGASD
jgi:flagellar biosynthesis/type III secretory pathway protein FliH